MVDYITTVTGHPKYYSADLIMPSVNPLHKHNYYERSVPAIYLISCDQ